MKVLHPCTKDPEWSLELSRVHKPSLKILQSHAGRGTAGDLMDCQVHTGEGQRGLGKAVPRKEAR